MLIKRVILENYGLFQGRNEFDLLPREKHRRFRPIILFGGKNGAGKTTLLDGVRLALYGKSSLGARVRQTDYDQFLRDRIHRSRKAIIQPTHASVGLEFEYVSDGKRETYLVERSWESKNGKGITEDLSILRNEKPLEDLDREHWQSFIRDIVPEGISQLFFFDGEKIKDLAEDDQGGALADSIKSLLGLDVVERLHADLSIYSGRAARQAGDEKDGRELEEIERRLEEKTADLGRTSEELAGIEAQVHGAEAEIRGIEMRLQSEGQAFAEGRDRLKADRTRLGEAIERAEKALRSESEALFPLALCPMTARALREQLEAEQGLRRWSLVRQELEKIEAGLLEALRKPSVQNEIGLGQAGRTRLEALICRTVEEQTRRPDGLADLQEIHGLSEVATNQILAWLAAAGGETAARVQSAATDLEKAHRALQKVERDIARAPDDATVRPVVEELNDRHRRLGALQERAETLRNTIRTAENEVAALARQRDRLIERCQGLEDATGRLRLVKSVQTALDDYLTRLTERKVADLSQTVAECFNRLSRKGDILQRIEIDPKTFAVTLYDRRGTALPKEELSSGEKQIYAISMLWGLAKTSRRALPVIVDTPLGRLDSDHRANLMKNYFPHAAHQVILLSTDTEVDQGLFKQISPEVSHSYHLVFDPAECRTEPVREYFWRNGDA